MNPTLILIILTLLSPVFLGGCESKNEQVKNTIRSTIAAVTPEALVEAVAKLEPGGERIPLHNLPEVIAAFKPLYIQDHGRGSYLIVTERWVQHQTGVFISAPGEVPPDSPEHVTYEKLGERVYLYQD